ncbi:Integrator complex subunit 2 [Phytophthora infestans]|nr:Integrator complex subunit 2 [Phytophthora infestans]
MPTVPSSSTASSQSLPSRLLSVVAAGELSILPDDAATRDSDEALDGLLTPFLPLMTRLQSLRRACSTSNSLPNSTSLDATLLRVEKSSKWRQYAQVFADLTPSQLQSAVIPDPVAAFRRFERGSEAEKVKIVLCEWLLAAPGSLESSELFLNEIYQEEVAAILVLTLASLKLQTQPITAHNRLVIQTVTRKALAVPTGPILLTRLAVNDPSCVEQLMDAIVATVVEATTTDQTMAQQEQGALTSSTSVVENARRACVHLAKLSHLYAVRLKEKLSQQTASLHCVAMALELVTTCLKEDVSVFMFQWLKRDGAPGSALRTYLQLPSREIASGTSDFQQETVKNLTILRHILLDTLDSATKVSPYELTAVLGVCVGLQVLDSFQLTASERIRLLQSLDKIASSSSSSRSVSLAFIMVVLLWYPLAPALSKAPGQRDEHTKTAVTLSQQVLVSLFQAREAGAGSLFVVSAVLFYTKAPALVPFLASVIGFNEDINSTGSGIQQALRAEYLHIFGDVILKPILTENRLAREVLTFPPVARVSAMDALASRHGQHEFTLRGLHGLLCEKSFLRHHHGHRLESWLATQIGEQVALPVHPLLVSVLLEWIENYVMAFEYPIAQAPRRLQLSIVPLRSSTLSKWLAAPCLEHAYGPSKGQDLELEWARGVLGLTYALQFNQRLRHATMVAGSKLSSLVSTSSGASVATALGPGADICLSYDLSAFPLRNIVAMAVAHGDQGGVFEYVAPTLLKLMIEEHPQLFDAATASASPGSVLQLLPLASSPRDVAARDLASSWFRRRRNSGDLPNVRVMQSPPSWLAAQTLLLELESAPIDVVMRELPVLVDGFLPYAVVSSHASSTSCRQVAAFCSQLAALYETRARREQGPSTSLLMKLVHALCFPDEKWRQQQTQTHQTGAFQLLTYMQLLEEPFRMVVDAHDGVYCQPALLRVLLGLVRDVRAAANVHVSKCDPSSVSVEGTSASASTASVQQHQLLQDCLLIHGLLKRMHTLSSEPSDNEVAEESRALLCGLVNELLAADVEESASSPRLLLAIHTQGYDTSLVPTLVANVPSMKLLWDHWMAATSSSSSGSSSRSATPGTKPLMEFVAEGAEKDLPKWRFRLRVVLSLCAAYLSGSRQSAAMQQALRVVWNKIRNGVGTTCENSAGYVTLLSEILPWIVDACSENADLSAELVHFLLKLQRQQQSGPSSKGRDGRRAVDTAGKPQEQRQLLEQVLRDTYASLLQQI